MIGSVLIPTKRPQPGPGLTVWDMAQLVGAEKLTLFRWGWRLPDGRTVPRRLRRALKLVELPREYVNMPEPGRVIVQAVADALGVLPEWGDGLVGRPASEGWQVHTGPIY